VKRIQRFGLLIVLVVAAFDLAGPAVAVQASSTERVVGTPTLIPKWSSAIPNYVVRCNDQPVQLSVFAQPGDSVSVDGQAAKTGNFVATTGALTAGQEFLITATTSSGTAVHHVRCLPNDFPTWTWSRNGGTRSQFFVVTPDLSFTPGNDNKYVTVFDTNGVPRWWKNVSPQSSPLDAKTLPNGDLVWSESFGNGSGGSSATSEYSLDGTLVRNFPTAAPGGGSQDFHDIQFLPNGNYLIVDNSKTVQMDLTPCGGSGPGPQVDPVIEELNPSTSPPTLVWSWDTAAHISLSEVASFFYPQCKNHDGYHFNALEYVPATSLHGESVLVSYRHLDAIYNISIADSTILWKLGGSTTPQSYQVTNDPVFAASGGFSGQHDVRLYTDDVTSGFQITLHDNGTDRSRPPRAVRYRIDTEAKTASLQEQVSDSSVTASGCCGSARKLVSGDWVISWGGTSHIEEVTAGGASQLYSLILGSGLFSYRVMPVTLPGGGRYAEPATWGDALTTGMNTMHPRSAPA
jgi:hypothetical protein